MSTRPCYLVVDVEYPGSISARKLVLESAKLNVITAYSIDEAIATLRRFPNVDGVVLNTQFEERRPCREVIDQLRSANSGIPVITVSPGGHDPCGGEQSHVSGFDPRQLLDALESLRPKDFPNELKDGAEPRRS